MEADPTNSRCSVISAGDGRLDPEPSYRPRAVGAAHSASTRLLAGHWAEQPVNVGNPAQFTRLEPADAVPAAMHVDRDLRAGSGLDAALAAGM
jgi:hypothetical protein